MNQDRSGTFLFPKWVDELKPLLGAIGLGLPVVLTFLVWYGGSPATTDVGYAPAQPVPYSHLLHAGQMGIDCRYCHTTVEVAAHAAIPPTQTCMNCHTNIRGTSPKLLPVRESNATGMPVPWVRVHDLPDYVYFNHSAHVRRGVGCVECHDRVDKMDVVYQAKKLSMGWCLDCHRNPDAHLRPPELVTKMDWPPAGTDRLEVGRHVRAQYKLNPSEDCSTCHR
jgi:hypothetical protein